MKFVVALALLAAGPLPARCSRTAARGRGPPGSPEAPPDGPEAAHRAAHGHHHHRHHHNRSHNGTTSPQPIGLRAEAAGPSAPFDCEAGKARWKLGWSGEKKEWCCKHEWWPECEVEGYASSLPFHCEEGLQHWDLGWSDMKKEWCCQNEPPRGCPPTTTTTATTPLPFDCQAGLAKWETGWSDEKKEWCCHNEPPKGCQPTTTTTTPRFDCQAGLAKWETGWSDEKKEWCCKREPPRGCLPFDCEAGLDRWETGWSGQKKEWCCENDGRGCSTTTTTTTTATTTSSSTPFDCDAGLPRWKTGWSDDKKQWCCENESPKGCDEPAFDCDAGLPKWESGWSGAKKEWCCEHESPKGCTITTSTTTTTPYDCDAGLPKWETGWSEAKKEWCCDTEPPKGCEITTTTNTTTPFDCDAGLTKWETGWSNEKKKWCCKHESPKGCSPGDLEEFDCDAGLSKWETGWSDDKREWCCEHQPPNGCATTTTTTTTTTALFDCDAGLAKWDTGWSDEKKDWCCKNKYPKGCSVEELPFDCAAGVPKWETGWSDAKKDWCCEHQPHRECPDRFEEEKEKEDEKKKKKNFLDKEDDEEEDEEEEEEEKRKAEPAAPEEPHQRERQTSGAAAPPSGPFPWVYAHADAVARDLELRTGARFFPEGTSSRIDMTENDRHRSDAVFSREPSVFDGCVLVRDVAAPLRVGSAMRRQSRSLRRNGTTRRTSRSFAEVGGGGGRRGRGRESPGDLPGGAGIPHDLPDDVNDMFSGPDGKRRKGRALDRPPEGVLLLRGGAYDLDSADTFGAGGGRANAELQLNMFAHLGSVAGEVPVVPHGAVANWMSKRKVPIAGYLCTGPDGPVLYALATPCVPTALDGSGEALAPGDAAERGEDGAPDSFVQLRRQAQDPAAESTEAQAEAEAEAIAASAEADTDGAPRSPQAVPANPVAMAAAAAEGAQGASTASASDLLDGDEDSAATGLGASSQHSARAPAPAALVPGSPSAAPASSQVPAALPASPAPALAVPDVEEGAVPQGAAPAPVMADLKTGAEPAPEALEGQPLAPDLKEGAQPTAGAGVSAAPCGEEQPPCPEKEPCPPKRPCPTTPPPQRSPSGDPGNYNVYVGSQLLTFSSKPKADRFCTRLAERIAEDVGDTEWDVDGLASDFGKHDLSVTDFMDAARRQPERGEWTLGTKRLLVVVMDWKEGDGSKPPFSAQTKDPSHYRREIFPKVQEAFHEMSYGRFELEVTVVPEVIRFTRRRARYTAVGYPFPGLYLGAEQSLEGNRQHGSKYRFADFDLVFVIAPRQQPVGTHGVSWVGAKGAMCNGCEDLSDDTQVMVAVHELGHNLGLGHAASRSLEYGNVFDWMGNYPGLAGLSFSVGYRERLRWLPTDAVAQITDQDLADLNNEYLLKPFDRGGAPRVGDLVGIHIRLADQKRDLYVAYRGGGTAEAGVYLTWQDRERLSTELVDAACHSPSQRDAALKKGWTYMDPSLRVVIHVAQIVGDLAIVHVFRAPDDHAVNAIRSSDTFTDGQWKCPRVCTDGDVMVSMYESCAMLAQDGYCPKGEVTMGGLRYNIRNDLCPNSCGTCDQATKGSTRVADGCADRTITINGLSCDRAASVGYCDAMTNLGNVGRDICMKSCGYCVPEPGLKALNASEAYTYPTPKRVLGTQGESARAMPEDSSESVLEAQVQEEEEEERYAEEQAADALEEGCADDPGWMDLDGDTCEVYSAFIKSGKMSAEEACGYNDGEARRNCRRVCGECDKEPQREKCQDLACVMKWRLEYGRCFRCEQWPSHCGDPDFAADCPKTCGTCTPSPGKEEEEAKRAAAVPQRSKAPATTTTEPPAAPPIPCRDHDCVDHWLKETGECYQCHEFSDTFCGRDEEFMEACPRSCKMCTPNREPSCEDNFSPHTCRRLAAWQWCGHGRVAEHCRASCGLCPTLPEETEGHPPWSGPESRFSRCSRPGASVAYLLALLGAVAPLVFRRQ